MKAQILTPGGPVFDGEVTGVQMPGIHGGFEVRHNHASLITLLDIGRIIVKSDNKSESDRVYAVSGGFAEVSNDVVTVMAEEAISSDDIDLEENLLKKEEVENQLKNLRIDTDEHERAYTELRKIINRINLVRNS